MVNFGSSKQKSESKPVKEMMWTPEQQRLAQQVTGQLQNFGPGGTVDVPKYPGELSVPRTPEEEAYFSSVANIPQSVQDIRAGKPAYTWDPDLLEKYYQDYVKAPAMFEFKDVALPGIKEQYAGPGYYGSARAKEVGDSYSDLARNLAASKSDLFYKERLRADEAQEAALGRVLPAYEQVQTQLGTAGALSRQVEQEKVAADFMRWMSGEEMEGVTPIQNNPFWQQVFAMLNYFPYQLGQETESTGTSTSFGVKLPVSWQFGGS